MTSTYIISEILKRNKITDYLASKGYHPIGSEINGKLRYLCPVHKTDSSPSFYVYTNGDHENYYCYGCKSNNNIIHLVSALEGIKIADSLRKLSSNINFNFDLEFDHVTMELEKSAEHRKVYTPAHISYQIARQIYDFKKTVEFDTEYTEGCDKLCRIVDESVVTGNYDNLELILNTIFVLFPKKTKEFLNAKKKKDIRSTAELDM